jgi:hypothetical protein
VFHWPLEHVAVPHGHAPLIAEHARVWAAVQSQYIGAPVHGPHVPAAHVCVPPGQLFAPPEQVSVAPSVHWQAAGALQAWSW